MLNAVSLTTNNSFDKSSWPSSLSKHKNIFLKLVFSFEYLGNGIRAPETEYRHQPFMQGRNLPKSDLWEVEQIFESTEDSDICSIIFKVMWGLPF